MTAQAQEGTGTIEQASEVIHKAVESLKGVSQEVMERVKEVRLASLHIGEFMDKAKGIAGENHEA
jgi:methyl-accepting chemotaxis protein